MFAELQAGVLLDRKQWDALNQEPGLRIGETVEFAFWVPEESWGEGEDAFADELMRSAKLAPEEEGLLVPRKAGGGRGAAGLVLVLQLIGTGVAGAGGVVGVVEFCKLVKRVWKRLVLRGKSESGAYELPMLSLQTTVLLVIADLSAKMDVSDYRVVWAGDVGGGLACDVGHSGQDLFLTLLSNGSVWHLYLTDS